MSSIRLLPAAERDIEEIHAYTVAQWGSSQARRYLRGLQQSLERLATFPAMGREITRTSNVRIWNYRSHRVIYIAAAEGVIVSRIFHSARDIDLLSTHLAALEEKR